MCRTPRWATASTTAFCTAGVEPIVPASPMPLAPSGLSGVGVSDVDQLEAGQLGGRDDRVVGEGGGQRVAVGVVEHLLQQRLRRALGDPAVPLALGEQRVEHRPGVVDGDQPDQLRLAGLGVHLDHRHVGAERERRRRAALKHACAPSSRSVAGQLGQRTPRLRGRRATCKPAELAVDDEVLRVGLEHARRPAAGPRSTSSLGGLVHRRAALLQAARAVGAAALGDQVGVAVHRR